MRGQGWLRPGRPVPRSCQPWPARGTHAGADLVVTRYLFREIAGTLVGVLFVLLLIFASKHFVRYLSDAAAGLLPTSLVLQILAYFLLSSLIFILPFAFYITVLIALGRLYQDNEITAMEACGVGIPRIMRSVAGFALLFAAGVAALSLWIAPWAESQQYAIRDQARAQSQLALVAEGRFHDILGGRGVFYVEELSDDKRRMTNVFVQIENEDKVDVFSARSGFLEVYPITGHRYVVLQDGYRYERLPDGRFRIHRYEEGGVRVLEPEISRSGTPHPAKPTTALLDSDERRDQAEFQWRLSMPLSAVLLGILAVLLSRTSPRQGRFAKLFVALVIYAVYFNLMTLSESWIEKGELPAAIGMWWTHLVIVALIIWLMGRQFGWPWILSSLRPGRQRPA